jgi:serine/threonine protein kinase HipA of HipAB toxin-antitoxin module
MGLVRHIEANEELRPGPQKSVEATYSAFELNGEHFVQVDTYGSSDRQMLGKRSQSMRFDRVAAEQLFEILKREFSL